MFILVAILRDDRRKLLLCLLDAINLTTSGDQIRQHIDLLLQRWVISKERGLRVIHLILAFELTRHHALQSRVDILGADSEFRVSLASIRRLLGTVTEDFVITFVELIDLGLDRVIRGQDRGLEVIIDLLLALVLGLVVSV